jgi:hypothetical protein
MTRAKTQSTPSSEKKEFFFAFFAPLREIFRLLVAAPPRYESLPFAFQLGSG